MTMNRRKLITLMGAAATAAPSSLPSSAKAPAVTNHAKKCAIIMVADQTVPSLQIRAQFKLFRSHNKALGLPFDEHMCFGLAARDGAKKSVKLCTKLINGWIASMRLHGIEKIAVLAWSHRFGPVLTIPMLLHADIRLARTSGYNRKFVSAFLRAANKKPIVAHNHGWNVVTKMASTLSTCWLTMALSRYVPMSCLGCRRSVG